MPGDGATRGTQGLGSADEVPGAAELSSELHRRRRTQRREPAGRHEEVLGGPCPGGEDDGLVDEGAEPDEGVIDAGLSEGPVEPHGVGADQEGDDPLGAGVDDLLEDGLPSTAGLSVPSGTNRHLSTSMSRSLSASMVRAAVSRGQT